jgi:hypothetical protein
VTKRPVVLAVGVPVAVLLVALSQVWATGTSQDPVLGRATLTVTGSQMVPAAVGMSLVIVSALVTLLSGGPRIGTAAGVLMALAALAALILIGTSLGSAEAALGRRAAELAGRTGSPVPVTGGLGPWAWVAAAAAGAAAMASVAATVAARRWAGLSARFERSGGGGGTDRGARRSDWDDLTEGHDPTRADSGEGT